jgi:hypothetical protein
MILASFETPSCSFQTLATTKDAAYRQLEGAWRKHSQQSGADPGYLKEYKDDVHYVAVEVGTVLRDGELMAL